MSSCLATDSNIFPIKSKHSASWWSSTAWGATLLLATCVLNGAPANTASAQESTEPDDVVTLRVKSEGEGVIPLVSLDEEPFEAFAEIADAVDDESAEYVAQLRPSHRSVANARRRASNSGNRIVNKLRGYLDGNAKQSAPARTSPADPRQPATPQPVRVTPNQATPTLAPAQLAPKQLAPTQAVPQRTAPAAPVMPVPDMARKSAKLPALRQANSLRAPSVVHNALMDLEILAVNDQLEEPMIELDSDFATLDSPLTKPNDALPQPPLLIADAVAQEESSATASKPEQETTANSVDVAPSVSDFRGGGLERAFGTQLPSRAATKHVKQTSPRNVVSIPRERPTPTRVPGIPMAPSLSPSTLPNPQQTLPPAPPQLVKPQPQSLMHQGRMFVPEPGVMISRKMRRLQPEIAKTLRFYYDRPLNTKDDSAWSIMHSFLGFGENTPVAVGGNKGRRSNAVNWMCWNNPCAGRSLLYLSRDGYITGHEGPGVQGHPCQFLAMLAQINMRRDYPLRVNGQTYKIEDLVNAEMRSCTVDTEMTFKLIALSHYLDSEAQWKTANGETWDLRKILNIELSQPVNGAACGGTHRVMAISYAVRAKERRGEPLDAIYMRAKNYVREYHRYTMSLQNRDGGFSSDWFKLRSDWGDKDRQLQTTGHMLEWLVHSVPRNELSDPRIVKAVEFLSDLMTQHRYHDWEVGPRGHALRALSLYQQRVFMPQSNGNPMAQRQRAIAK